MEEIYLEGPLGNTDIRIINSYPSKVEHARAKSPQTSAPKVRKSPQTSAPKVQSGQKAYLAPGAIEKHVAPPETCVVAFPSSCEKFVTFS